MVYEKAWYLVAAGVLALGISNGFVSRGENWARGLAERSISIVEGASSQTMRLPISRRLLSAGMTQALPAWKPRWLGYKLIWPVFRLQWHGGKLRWRGDKPREPAG